MKMNKKSKRYLIMLLVFLTVFMVFGTALAFATGITDWVKGDANDDLTHVSGQMEKGGRSIFKLITTFGQIAGLIILSIYGIKWFLSRNDSSARKELKDSAVGYLVGAIIFFGAEPLYKIIYSFAKAFEVVK